MSNNTSSNKAVVPEAKGALDRFKFEVANELDWNKKQIDGTVDECISLLDIAEKFRAFGWYAVTVKGDDIEAIQMAFKQTVCMLQ